MFKWKQLSRDTKKENVGTSASGGFYILITGCFSKPLSFTTGNSPMVQAIQFTGNLFSQTLFGALIFFHKTVSTDAEIKFLPVLRAVGAAPAFLPAWLSVAPGPSIRQGCLICRTKLSINKTERGVPSAIFLLETINMSASLILVSYCKCNSTKRL